MKRRAKTARERATEAVVAAWRRQGLSLSDAKSERAAFGLVASASSYAFGATLLALGRRHAPRVGKAGDEMDLTAMLEQFAPLGEPAFAAVAPGGKARDEAAFVVAAHGFLGPRAFEALVLAGLAVIQVADARRMAAGGAPLTQRDLGRVADEVGEQVAARIDAEALPKFVNPALVDRLSDEALALAKRLR